MTASTPSPRDASVALGSTPGSTRATFAKKAGRGYTPVRNSLVQVKDGNKWVGSTLGRLVEARQPRALLAYLLLLMSWPWLDRREKPLEAAVWARALSPDEPDPRLPARAMSRIWGTLDGLRLIERSREGHLVRVIPRREDAGASYTRPRPDQEDDAHEKFFSLPDAFWLDGWYAKLSFPGIAVLLILLAETQGRRAVHLSLEDSKAWYGLSSKTMQNGLNELRKNGLLGEQRDFIVNDLSAIGRKPHFTYWPMGDFGHDARNKLQRAAKQATRKRAAAGTATKKGAKRIPKKKLAKGVGRNAT